MRSDREAAVAVLVDETAERDRRVVGEALRRETRFGGATKFRATTSEEDGDDEARAPAGRNYRHDDDGDRDDEDVVRPPTPRSRAPREPAARTRDTRPDDDDDDDDNDLGNEDEEEDRYSRRVHDWARGFDVRLDRAGNASAVRLGGSSDPPTRPRVPWGHGPGTSSAAREEHDLLRAETVPTPGEHAPGTRTARHEHKSFCADAVLTPGSSFPTQNFSCLCFPPRRKTPWWRT